MSNDYSSFEKDKKIFDNWRIFLNEGPPIPRFPRPPLAAPAAKSIPLRPPPPRATQPVQRPASVARSKAAWTPETAPATGPKPAAPPANRPWYLPTPAAPPAVVEPVADVAAPAQGSTQIDPATVRRPDPVMPLVGTVRQQPQRSQEPTGMPLTTHVEPYGHSIEYIQTPTAVPSDELEQAHRAISVFGAIPGSGHATERIIGDEVVRSDIAQPRREDLVGHIWRTGAPMASFPPEETNALDRLIADYQSGNISLQDLADSAKEFAPRELMDWHRKHVAVNNMAQDLISGKVDSRFFNLELDTDFQRDVWARVRQLQQQPAATRDAYGMNWPTELLAGAHFAPDVHIRRGESLAPTSPDTPQGRNFQSDDLHRLVNSAFFSDYIRERELVDSTLDPSAHARRRQGLPAHEREFIRNYRLEHDSTMSEFSPEGQRELQGLVEQYQLAFWRTLPRGIHYDRLTPEQIRDGHAAARAELLRDAPEPSAGVRAQRAVAAEQAAAAQSREGEEGEGDWAERSFTSGAQYVLPGGERVSFNDPRAAEHREYRDARTRGDIPSGLTYEEYMDRAPVDAQGRTERERRILGIATDEEFEQSAAAQEVERLLQQGYISTEGPEFELMQDLDAAGINDAQEVLVDRESLSSPETGPALRPYGRTVRDFVVNYIREHDDGTEAFYDVLVRMTQALDNEIPQSSPHRAPFARVATDLGEGPYDAAMVYTDLRRRGEIPRHDVAGTEWQRRYDDDQIFQEHRLYKTIEEEYQKLLLEVKR